MECIKNIKSQKPIIHNITNYVTVNDVANVLLGIGASPIMSDAPEEMEDIASICSALNINIGTLNKETVKAMHIAGRKAALLSKPVIFDAVGAGASRYRTDTALELMENIRFSVIKGNISEINSLFKGTASTSGVDANELDLLTKDNEQEVIQFIKNVALKKKTIFVVTGKRDIVTNGEKVILIDNGCREMKNVTGTGCMISALLAAFVAANPDNCLLAAAEAVMAMGIAGEIALECMNEGEGNLSYRKRILDAIYNITDEVIKEKGRYEVL